MSNLRITVAVVSLALMGLTCLAGSAVWIAICFFGYAPSERMVTVTAYTAFVLTVWFYFKNELHTFLTQLDLEEETSE